MIEVRDDVRTFKLYDHQHLGLSWVGKYNVICMSGGVQDGKTTWMLLAFNKYIEEVNPSPPAHVERTLWLVLPKRDQFWEAIKPKIEYIFGWQGQGGKIIERNLSKPSYLLEAMDGGTPWELFVRTAEDENALRSATICAAGITEAGLVSPGTFDILLGRLAMRDGPLFLDSSPFGLNWLYQRVISKAAVVADYRPDIPAIYQNPEGDSRIAVLHGIRIELNRSMDPKVIERLRSGSSLENARREYDGEFFSWSGLIWNAFDPRKHVPKKDWDRKEDFEKSPERWEIVAGMDFGYGHPSAHLWVATTGGRYRVLEEYRAGERTLKTHAHEIKKSGWHQAVTYRYGDPSAAQAMAEMGDYGLHFSDAENDVELGLNRVQQLFEQGKLEISPACVKLIQEIGAYHRDERTGKPVKVADDLCDALRYAIYTHSLHSDGMALPYAVEDQRGAVHLRGDEKVMVDEYSERMGKADYGEWIPGDDREIV